MDLARPLPGRGLRHYLTGAMRPPPRALLLFLAAAFVAESVRSAPAPAPPPAAAPSPPLPAAPAAPVAEPAVPEITDPMLEKALRLTSQKIILISAGVAAAVTFVLSIL